MTKFKYLLQNHWAILSNLSTKQPLVTRIQDCLNEMPCPFPRGDNYEIDNGHWQNLKIFFSRTTEPILTKFSTKHPWVMKTQVCSNEVPCPFLKVDNYKIGKIHWQIWKIFFRTTCPISTKLGTMSPWVMSIQVCSNEEPNLFPRGDNYEITIKKWRN